MNLNARQLEGAVRFLLQICVDVYVIVTRGKPEIETKSQEIGSLKAHLCRCRPLIIIKYAYWSWTVVHCISNHIIGYIYSVHEKFEARYH